MLSIKNVTKKYGTFTAIEEINLEISAGSIFGLVGYNGAGKTTLLKTICGILKPEQGTVAADTAYVFDNPVAKRRIFFVSDDPYYFPQASMNRMAKFYKSHYPLWNTNMFGKLTEIFGLDPSARISGFSKGMQRQASIILALSAMPDYLLLDEAFDGIDPMMRELVRRLLLEAIAERETCVIISSHNLRELEDLCDRAALLNGKRVVFDADIDEMRLGKNKYKAAFSAEVSEDGLLALGIHCKEFKSDGKVVTFIADGPAEEIKQKLMAKQPLLLESMPLTLEEIFLLEMGVSNYDFTDLFK